jgi:hypothetical protein
LIQAYRIRGGDPQALLPKLALYMGHVSIDYLPRRTMSR